MKVKKDYESFWDELSHIYPVSKGKLRLPIATAVIELNNLISKSDIEKLKEYLQIKINLLTSKESKKRLVEKGDTQISNIPFEKLNGVVRFDCMIDEYTNQLKVIEINSDYPDGFLLHDKTFSILSGVETKTHELYLESNFINNEYVFILHPENAFFLDTYYSELELLKSLNIKCGIGTIADINFKNKYFWHGENKISKIRRCCEVYKLPETFFVETKTKIINNLYMRALGYKDYLTGEYEFLLKATDLRQDNLLNIISEKNKWVLKPTNLSEGKGIIIGADSNELEWKQEVTNAFDKGRYIVQEYLHPKKITIEYYDDGQTKKDTFYFDICPHFFITDGKVTGIGHILMRFSKEKILNVTKGGAIGYGAFN